MINCGVLYIVTAHKSDIYIKAAIKSAESLVKHSPSINKHIFTDSKGKIILDNMKYSPFNSIGLIENAHYRSKVDYMSLSPFDKTIYLDSDTEVVNDITELFQLLDWFDIAIAHAHRRNIKSTTEIWKTAIPTCYPQFNSGVIAYKKNNLVSNFLNAWKESFHTAGFKKDQVTLRELLYTDTKLRLATLPPEYNVRYEKYLKIWDSIEAKAKILHMAKYHSPKKNNFISRFKNNLGL